MATWRWPPAPPPEDLGAIAHGPALLARAPDIAAGLRCVWAHHDGLCLPLVVQARGVHAEAATRQTFSHSSALSTAEDDPSLVGSAPRLVVAVNEHSGVAEAGAGASSGGDSLIAEPMYWVGELPRDGLLHLALSWP